MTRLQILELPEGSGDDRPPYVLVVDQTEPQRYILGEGMQEPPNRWDVVAKQIGARGSIVVPDTVTIPANEVLPLPLLAAETDDEPDNTDGVDYTEMIETVNRVLGINSGRGKPDVAGWLLTACRELEKSEAARAHLRSERQALKEERTEARMWARHGYEIGQRHCGWTDHGVAPAWLTEGWPPHIDSCEHLARASEYDTALGRVLEVATDLEAAEAHGGAWDANQQAARCIRAAVGRPRDDEVSGS